MIAEVETITSIIGVAYIFFLFKGAL